MSERPDLALDEAERAAFLGRVLAEDTPVAFAVAGRDGYPEIGLVAAVYLEGEVVLAGDEPADGRTACVIIERGATYDDITAVVARGQIRSRRLSLDDVVSFAFAKLGRRM